MTWIYNGDLANPIADDAPFKGSDGTKYPGNWDKSGVAKMEKVVETPKPDASLNVVTGHSIQLVDGVPTRVWTSAPRTAKDLKDRANAPILTEIVAKEKLTLRPMRELRRAQEYADVPVADVAFAKDRIKTLDDEIKALRAQLQN